jgi:hypothetical protein
MENLQALILTYQKYWTPYYLGRLKALLQFRDIKEEGV